MNYQKQIEVQSNQTETYLEIQSGFSISCGLHSTNNLLGSPKFKQEDFDQICEELSPSTFCNPHRHRCLCFVGDYDANVIFKALDTVGFECLWIDGRKEFNVKKLEQMLNGMDPIGFLINIEKEDSFLASICKKVFCLSPRHWCCIRRVGTKYALLDSLVEEPSYFETIDNVIWFINSEREKNAEMMVVKEKEK